MTKETTIIVCPNCMRGFEIEGKIILDAENTFSAPNGQEKPLKRQNSQEQSSFSGRISKDNPDIHIQIKDELQKDYASIMDGEK